MSVTNESELILEGKSIYSLYKGREGAANVVALRGLNLKLKKVRFWQNWKTLK